jgi:glycosyltransferase involved in cell wall biosynthesis
VDVIQRYSKAKIVLRAHNVEHQLWEYNAQLTNNPLKKGYLNILAKRLKQYELNSLRTVDSIIAITKQDEDFFKQSGFSGPIKTIPFGIDLEKYVKSDAVNELQNSLFHIGAMDWQPNIEGVSWFLNKVWNKVQLKNSGLQLFLAGRNISKEFKQQNIHNVVIVGEVENAYDFMRSKGLMVVPLLSGGGMRVKIIEGMAFGKAIISTSIGAEGIDYVNNKNIIIADTPNEFVEAIGKCIKDKLFAESIGNDARMLVENKYNNKIISENLLGFYQRLIA